MVIILVIIMVGKTYAGILIDIVRRVTGNDEQLGFRIGKGCVDQIFTLKEIGEKAQEKKSAVCMWVL